MRLRFAALAAACLSCLVAVDALAEECRAPTVTFQAPALLTGLGRAEAMRPLRIVAVGSSSTQGVGASGPLCTYPAQLALALGDRLPGTTVEVLNKGIGGEVVADNLRRLDRDVLQKPDLVIWQVGTNDAWRGLPLYPVQAQLRDGIGRIREQGAAPRLINPQPVPRAEDEQAIAAMSAMIAKVAKATGTPLFSRHQRMLGWISRRDPRRRHDLLEGRPAQDGYQLPLPGAGRGRHAGPGGRGGGDGCRGRTGDRHALAAPCPATGSSNTTPVRA